MSAPEQALAAFDHGPQGACPTSGSLRSRCPLRHASRSALAAAPPGASLVQATAMNAQARRFAGSLTSMRLRSLTFMWRLNVRRLSPNFFVLVAAVWASSAAIATPDPWSYEAVATHPRWKAFVAKLDEAYVVPVSKDRFNRLCTKLLDATRDEQKGDPVDSCIISALFDLDRGVSSYSNPAQFAEEQANQKRKFVGVGLELDAKKIRGKPMRVVQPIADSPSARAGVLPGDEIVEVEGIDVLPLTARDVINAMRGEVGTPMRLTLLREGWFNPLKLSITREDIHIATVKAKWLADRIAYVRLSQLREETPDALVRKMRMFDLEPGNRAAGLILDLRLNPGGLFDPVVPIASQFVSGGIDVVSVTSRSGVKTHRTVGPVANASMSSSWQMSTPMVVLIDEKTAGGAEALAQFLRERRSAKLVGVRTAGAPEIRTYQQVGDDAAMRLYSGRMITSSGQAWFDGIAPDVVFGTEPENFDFADDRDEWLKRAVIELRKIMAP